MTRNEGVALIKEQLAFKTTLDSNIVTYLKLAQTTLEKSPTKPWFLIQNGVSLVTVADQQTIDLPVGFLNEVEDVPLYYVNSDGARIELVKDDFTSLQRVYSDYDPAEPEAYALVNDKIHVFPVPDDTYNLEGTFYIADTALDTDVENAWLREVPLLLLGSAGQLIAGGPIRDKDAMAIFTQWITTGLKIVSGHDTQRDMSRRGLQMGGRHN